MILPLAAVPFVMTIVMALWVIICLALVFIIMIQKGKGGGLSAAFGGASGTSSLFGAKTGDALTWITIGIAGFFLFLSVIMGLYYKPTVSSAASDAQVNTSAPAPQEQPAPQTPAAPAQPKAPGSSMPAAPVQPQTPAQSTPSTPAAPAQPQSPAPGK
jgi:preprotein translocase subunit SecG